MFSNDLAHCTASTADHKAREACIRSVPPMPARSRRKLKASLRLSLMLALTLPGSACRRSPLPDFGTASDAGSGPSSDGEDSEASNDESGIFTGTTDSSTTSGSTSAGDSTTTAGAICGDGVRDIGEDCDDGNLDNTDNCLNSCNWASCGDSHVHEHGEDCDDGNLHNTDDCLDSCEWPSCGDAYVHAGVELCDDGNTDSTDDCLPDCTWAHCGDGFTQQGVEDCDDSNQTSGDGCSAKCKLEYTVFVSSSQYDGSLNKGVQFPDLAGLDRADAICNKLADDAKLEGEYKAWLSDTSESPLSRLGLYDFEGEFLLTNSKLIASGWHDLTDGSLAWPINKDQHNNLRVGEVWTNTNYQGTVQQSDPKYSCYSWSSTSNQYSAYLGSSDQQSTQWTTQSTQDCSLSAHLYCFQVSAPADEG